MIIDEVVIIMNQIKGKSIMNSISIFWLVLYVSWVTVEFITKEYKMNERNRIKWLAITTVSSMMIAISCSGEKKSDVKELSFSEQMDIKYAHVVAHNDSVAAMWKEVKETSVSLDSVLNSPYEPDSSKIIAIKYPDDRFTDFEQAFKKARYDLGSDKYFIWKGEMYSTNYREEGYPPWTYQSKLSMEQQ